MNLALIADVGTTNIKAGVVDVEGNILSYSSREVELIKPQNGAAVHDPEELFNFFTDMLRKVAHGYREDISVLGLSGYQFGFLPLDEEKRPLMGMMTLLDSRSKTVMKEFRNKFPTKELYKRTGCPPLFVYILPKLIWLEKERPKIFSRAKWFGDIKSFLLQKLTGRLVTEPSIASATQLFNIHRSDWDERVLAMAGIGRERLPSVVPGDEIVAELPEKSASVLGLRSEIPVLPGVYDGGAMIVGMGGLSEEIGICNLGTTAMLRTSSSKPLLDSPEKMRFQTYALTSSQWAIGGAINNGGLVLRWFRDNLSEEGDYNKIMAKASEVNPGADGLFCLPFLTGERDPRIGNTASGSLFGLKEFHTREHISRAMLEGVGYSLKLLGSALEENGVDVEKVRIGGSGAKSDLWPQIISSMLRTPVERTLTEDATLVGGAMLAFTAIGAYSDVGEASESMIRRGKVFTPIEEESKIYERGYEFFRHLIEKMGKIYPMHAEKFR